MRSKDSYGLRIYATMQLLVVFWMSLAVDFSPSCIRVNVFGLVHVSCSMFVPRCILEAGPLNLWPKIILTFISPTGLTLKVKILCQAHKDGKWHSQPSVSNGARGQGKGHNVNFLNSALFSDNRAMRTMLIDAINPCIGSRSLN